jgi:ribonucleoside-diphosphate reductase alpha chain
LQVLVDKFSHARFEPSGMTKNPEVRFAKSIVDYIFRWMATKFLSPEAQYRAGVNMREEVSEAEEEAALVETTKAEPALKTEATNAQTAGRPQAAHSTKESGIRIQESGSSRGARGQERRGHLQVALKKSGRGVKTLIIWSEVLNRQS